MPAKPGFGFRIWTAGLSVFVAVMLFPNIVGRHGVARSLLITDPPDVVLHVVDARNLERMLALTFQLIETGLPLVLVLNLMDEAEKCLKKIIEIDPAAVHSKYTLASFYWDTNRQPQAERELIPGPLRELPFPVGVAVLD